MKLNLLSQELKQDMEECKRRAREAGLQFSDETLEYTITNQGILELMPKYMISSLYDHWLQDVEVHRNKWIYDVYPHNPYEITVNTRPAISYYNQDNADWRNVVIFYHVLGHVDMCQNNVYFRHTWGDDFWGQAWSDKQIIERIRQEKGAEKRWVDYVIEFALAVDNLVGYYAELDEIRQKEQPGFFGPISEKLNYYFTEFLKKKLEEKAIEGGINFYYQEIERYNQYLEQFGSQESENTFFNAQFFRSKFPEFNEVFKKWKEKKEKERPKPKDILQYLMEYSEFIQKPENKWIKEVIEVIRRTSLYFQPMIRTKICHEGWASLWHERLYVPDERNKGQATAYAVMDAHTVVDPRIGLNPYSFGKHLFLFIEELASKGKLSPDPEYQLLRDIEIRRKFDKKLGKEHGKKTLFAARTYFDDRELINFLSDEDFQDFMNKYQYFLTGIRPPKDIERILRGMLEVYIKSKKAQDLRALLNKFLYHPPYLIIDQKEGELYLNHKYEGRTLVTEYIPNVLMGLEYLWGKPVNLETTEYEAVYSRRYWWWYEEPEYKKVRVLYTCRNRKTERKVLRTE